MLYRIGGIYLWAALILASFLMDVQGAAGVGAVLVAGAVHLALLVAAVWISGARKTEAGLTREHPSFLPRVLLPFLGTLVGVENEGGVSMGTGDIAGQHSNGPSNRSRENLPDRDGKCAPTARDSVTHKLATSETQGR